MLRHRGVEEGNVCLIKLLLTNTSLRIKRCKSVRTEIDTDIETPQGDGLSRKIFIIYLDEALSEIEQASQPEYSFHDYAQQHSGLLLHDHEHPEKGIPEIPNHLKCSFDVDFLFSADQLADKVVKIIKGTLENYNLQLNESKME